MKSISKVIGDGGKLRTLALKKTNKLPIFQ